MTEAEWNACEVPHLMLVFLRGEVSPEMKEAVGTGMISSGATLYRGPGQWITGDQCRRFIVRCADRLRELPLDEPSRQALDAHRRYVLEGAPRQAFLEACLRIQEVVVAGGSSRVSHLAEHMWTHDPAGASIAVSDIAWTAANVKAGASVAVTCADATEEDWFNWGFSSGPPDPLWQSTHREEERFQANVLREVVGYPFQTVS